jgi:hypothetical protein
MREQTAPKVIVFLRLRPERPTMIYIAIKNIGGDIAEAVTFKSSRQLPAQAFGLPEGNLPAAKVMTHGPLINGIPALGPGEERELLWGQYGGLSAQMAEGPFVLQILYRQGRRRLSGVATLELDSFKNSDISEAESLKMVRHLETLAKQSTIIAKAVSESARRRALKRARKTAQSDVNSVT